MNVNISDPVIRAVCLLAAAISSSHTPPDTDRVIERARKYERYVMGG